MFDSKTAKYDQFPIKAVAQRSYFYTPEIESWLENEIERPGNDALDKLIRFETISDAERRQFARYIACMFMRVPEKRERMIEGLPAAMERTRAELPARLRQMGIEQRKSEIEIEEMLAQIPPVTEGLLESPPQELTDFINDPRPIPESVDAIASMNWMMMKSPPSLFFITSDNPGFFVPDALLKHKESEVFLPLSPRFAFHACYESRAGSLGIVENIPKAAVIELNRRTARQATRHCFCHEKAEWILRLMKRTHPLRPIRFPGPVASA